MKTNTFRKTRNNSRKKWIYATGRKRYINDDISGSMECDWQDNYVPSDMHNSLFCSLGEWSANITDLLYEESYDKYSFETPSYNNALFRHYTRILLITSEIMTDFQDALVYLIGYKIKDARKKLSNPNLPFTLDDLFCYINNVCKHKFAKSPEKGKPSYHFCNHHVDYVFEDSASFSYSPDRISVQNITKAIFSRGLPIEVPKLEYIIDQILFAYSVFDGVIKGSGQAEIRKKLEGFEVKMEGGQIIT